MWRARTSRTSDAAAAAQRRLSAIAAEFDRSPDSARVSPSASSRPLRAAPDPAATGSEGGRHRQQIRAWAGGRRRLTAQHLVVVTALVALLLAVAAWWALRSVPHEQAVPLASRTVSRPGHDNGGQTSDVPSPGTSSISTPTGGVPVSSPEGVGLVVDVAGKVRRPGIVELPAGARVIDALAAAGGARPGVPTAGLNLARPLVDGEQIVVGLEVPPGPPAAGVPPPAVSTSTAPASVDINTADQIQLETLPGIGPVTAQSILDWRAENGSFTSIGQLLDVSGIGDATLADIEPYVHV